MLDNDFNRPEDNVQNNSEDQNNHSSFSYNYPKENNAQSNGPDIEKPKKKKHVFTKVIAFAVCAAVISAGSIQCYRYLDSNDKLDGFFSRSSSSQTDKKEDSGDDDNSSSQTSNKATGESKSWLQLAARSDGLTIPDLQRPAETRRADGFSVRGRLRLSRQPQLVQVL